MNRRQFGWIAAGILATPTRADDPPPPVVLLKLDDLMRITPRWQRVVDFLEAEGLKANFGIINSALEVEDPKFNAWVKRLDEKGTIEFWHHGYDAKYPHDDAHKGEFEGSGLDLQRKALKRGQELAKLRFGKEYTSFGPHYSGTDADTFAALEGIPGIQVVWFYAPRPPARTSKLIIERRMELEQPIFQPNPAFVKERYEAVGRKKDYIAIQGHPDQWDDARFANFQEAVRFLKGRGCRFVTVGEWLAGRKGNLNNCRDGVDIIPG
ncbi:MAG: polysaccharide deacetylase family protein [Isosphaeraceae bacterium]